MHIDVWRSWRALPFEQPTFSASMTAASGSMHLCTRAGLGILCHPRICLLLLKQSKTLIPWGSRVLFSFSVPRGWLSGVQALDLGVVHHLPGLGPGTDVIAALAAALLPVAQPPLPDCQERVHSVHCHGQQPEHLGSTNSCHTHTSDSNNSTTFAPKGSRVPFPTLTKHHGLGNYSFLLQWTRESAKVAKIGNPRKQEFSDYQHDN